MTNPKKADLSQVLLQIKQEYLQNLPQKIIELETLLANSQLEALTCEFHKLYGNGKTSGYPWVSEIASVTQSYLKTNKDQAQNQMACKTALQLLTLCTQTAKKNQTVELSHIPEWPKLLSLTKISG